MMTNQLKIISLKNLKKSDESFDESFVDKIVLIPAPKEIALSEENETLFLKILISL